MVRNLLSLKCQRARERQLVAPAPPMPEGHRVTSVTCHGHQLCSCVPSAAGRVSRGVSYSQPFPAVHREAALNRCVCPSSGHRDVGPSG